VYHIYSWEQQQNRWPQQINRMTNWKEFRMQRSNALQLYILRTFPVLMYTYLIMPFSACVNAVLLFYLQSHSFWLILISASIKQDDPLILADTKLLPSVVPIHSLLEEVSKNLKQEYNSHIQWLCNVAVNMCVGGSMPSAVYLCRRIMSEGFSGQQRVILWN